MRLRRAIALGLAFIMLIGCTKAIDVPADRFEAASHVEGVSHLIELNNGASYAAREFAMTDSTLVILKLNHTRDMYTSKKVPVTLRSEDIKAIKRLELNREKSFFFLAGTGLLTVLIITFLTLDFSSN